MSKMGDWVKAAANRISTPADRRVVAKTDLSNQAQGLSMGNSPSSMAPFATSTDNRLTAAAMGPGEAPRPFPLGGEPRQWQYRVGWNFPSSPDTDRGIGADLLRTLADACDLVRRCIEIRKAELCGLDWDIVPCERQASKSKQVIADNADLIAQIKEFFKYPEGYYSTDDKGKWQRKGKVRYMPWLNALLEDYFVGDWLTIWPRVDMAGRCFSLERVAGENIKPLLDLDGRIPPHPMPAYQAYLYGVPRASFTAEEIIYAPRNLRNQTPYGYSLIEQALTKINMALRFDLWNTAAYTDGSIPTSLLEAPEGMSPDQIKEICDFINSNLAGLAAARQQLYPVPAGTKIQGLKPFQFDEKFAMYLVEFICGLMDVSPEEVGFSPARSGLGGAGFSETQDTFHYRKSLRPTGLWIASILTEIIHRFFNAPFLEFHFLDLSDENLADKYNMNKTALMSGQKSLDEILEDMGADPVGMGHMIDTTVGIVMPDEKCILTRTGAIVPMPFGKKPEDIAAQYEQQQAQQQQGKAPPGQQPPDDQPLDDETKPDANQPTPQDHQQAQSTLPQKKTSSVVAELGKWRKKAISDVKGGRRFRPFASQELTQEITKLVTVGLETAKTSGDVYQVFKQAEQSLDDRKKLTAKMETAFATAYGLWWKQKMKTTPNSAASPDQVVQALQMSQADVTNLGAITTELLRGSYLVAMNLTLKDLGQPPADTIEHAAAELKIATLGHSNAVKVQQTYNSKLNQQADNLHGDLAQENPGDQKAQATGMLAQLKNWVDKYHQNKALQVAAVLATTGMSMGSKDTLQWHEVPRMRWRATDDEKTCDFCDGQDGSVHDLSDYDMIPAHIGCRCWWEDPDTGEALPDSSDYETA